MLGLLNRFAQEAGADKALNGHGYTPLYEMLFRPRRVASILEIGVAGGQSMIMWRTAFPDARIFGIDIEPAPEELESAGIVTRQLDAGNAQALGNAAQELGPLFDVVVDDGSHRQSHQRMTLEVMWPHVSPGGLLIIEDLHTSTYGPEWSLYEAGVQTTVLKSFLQWERGIDLPDGAKRAFVFATNLGDSITGVLEK
jgi:predicted O-methyltransferase YrrM